MKLTDTQMVVLSAASQREDGSILPLPASIKGGAAAKVTGALLRKGLIAEAPRRNGAPIGETNYAITAEGAHAINVEPAECPHLADTAARAPDSGEDAQPVPQPRRKAKKAATGRDGPTGPHASRAGTKQALMIEMLRRSEGATVEQIMEATG